MVSQERTTSSRVGRKRSNQAAELSDVSIEDDSKDDSMISHPGAWKKSGCDKGAESDDERHVRKISCQGRKRCSAKGARVPSDDHTTTTGTKTEASNANTSDSTLLPSDSDGKRNEVQCPTTAATLHCSELKDPLEAPPTEPATPASEPTVQIETNGQNSDDMQEESNTAPSDGDCRSQARDEDTGREKVSGMPDWAAELDEVVPGVKVVSIKDVSFRA